MRSKRALTALVALRLGCGLGSGLGCGTESKRREEPAGTAAPAPTEPSSVAAQASTEAKAPPAADLAPKQAESKKGSVVGTGLEAPGALALDAEAAFVALTKRGEIVRVPFAKGERAVLATGLALETPAHAHAMAAAGAEVLVLTSGTESGVFEDGALLRIAKSGGTPKLVASKLRSPSNLVTFGEHLAFTTAADPGKRPPAVWFGTVTGAKKLWSPDGNEGEVCALALDGTHLYAVERLSDAETRIVRISVSAVGPDDAKLPTEPKGRARAKPKAKPTAALAEEVLARGTEVECVLAALGDDLYFPTGRGTLVRKVSKGGGEPRQAANVRSVGRVVALASGEGAVFGLAVQPAGAVSPAGAILRVTPTAFEYVATGEHGLQGLAVGPTGPGWSRWLELEQDGAVVRLP